MVLDLDETLIYFDLEKESLALRPYVRNFLRNVCRVWEVVIFTAGLKDYADGILTELDPQSKYFTRRFYRDDCVLIDGFYCKDLRKLSAQVDLARVVIVDNVAANFSI